MLLNQEDWENPTNIVAKLNVVVYFTYLHIQIVLLFHNILHTNHRPVIQVVSNSLDRWAALPMLIMGKNILKMNVFPNPFELFQNSLLILPNTFHLVFI